MSSGGAAVKASARAGGIFMGWRSVLSGAF